MCDAGVSRGAEVPDLQAEGTSAEAKRTVAGCRGNTSRRALLGPDFDWLNLTFGLD